MSSNVGPICKCCADDRKRKTQLALSQSTEPLVGKFAKIAFADGKATEHMWVRITGETKKGMVGVLDNDPVLVQNVARGDRVEFKRADIEELMS